MALTDPADPKTTAEGGDDTRNIAGELTFPTPGYMVNPELDKVGFTKRNPLPPSTFLSGQRQTWPIPVYRDDYRRRVFTAGTVLNILDDNNAGPESDGMFLSRIVAELYQVDATYTDMVPFRHTLITDTDEFYMLMQKLYYVEKLVSRVPVTSIHKAKMTAGGDKMGMSWCKWRLTERGSKALAHAYAAMKEADSPAVFPKVPIIAWASFSDRERLKKWYPTISEDGSVSDIVADTAEAAPDPSEPPRAPQGSTILANHGDGLAGAEAPFIVSRADAMKRAHEWHGDEEGGDGLTDKIRAQMEVDGDYSDPDNGGRNGGAGDGGLDAVDDADVDDEEIDEDSEKKDSTLAVSWFVTIGGDMVTHVELPKRRVTYKRPTFRQFAHVVQHEPHTVVGSMLHLHFYAPDDLWAAMEKIVATPQARKLRGDVRKTKRTVMQSRKAARTILGGGPEGVWIGKALSAKNVYDDMMAFKSAGTPGFDDELLQSMSLLMELYFDSSVTLNDFDAYQKFDRMVHGEIRTMRYVDRVYDRAVTLPPDEIDEKAFSKFQAKHFDAGTSGTTLVRQNLSIDPDATVIDADHDAKSVDDELFDQVTVRSWKRDTIDLLMEPGVLPKRRCSHWAPNRAGKNVQCTRLAAGTSDFCELHGGSVLMDTGEIQSLIAANARKMLALSGKAIETVADVMVNSPNDSARLQAAKMILDKSGFGDAIDINVAGEALGAGGDKETDMRKPSAEVVREKLDQLSKSIRAAGVVDEDVRDATMPEQPDSGTVDYIDAEVLDTEDEEQQQWMSNVDPTDEDDRDGEDVVEVEYDYGDDDDDVSDTERYEADKAEDGDSK